MGKKVKKQIAETAPWVEKYRPRTLDDVFGNADIIKNLRDMILSRRKQNILLIGDAGVGKTTVGKILAHMYGRTSDNIKEANASLLGRQAYLQNEIIPFCRAATLGKGIQVVFLDEFDYASPVMQASFRRVMEQYSEDGKCIFILACNYERKVLKAIRSRCAIYNFKKLTSEEMTSLAEKILEAEKIEYADESIEPIVEDARGLPREMIQSLQQNSVTGVLEVPKKAEIRGKIVTLMKNLFKEKNLAQAYATFNEILSTVTDDSREILRYMHDLTVDNEKAEPILKGKIIRAIADTDYKLCLDTTPEIQMNALITNLFLIASTSRKEDKTVTKPVPNQEE